MNFKQRHHCSQKNLLSKLGLCLIYESVHFWPEKRPKTRGSTRKQLLAGPHAGSHRGHFLSGLKCQTNCDSGACSFELPAIDPGKHGHFSGGRKEINPLVCLESSELTDDRGYDTHKTLTGRLQNIRKAPLGPDRARLFRGPNNPVFELVPEHLETTV